MFTHVKDDKLSIDRLPITSCIPGFNVVLYRISQHALTVLPLIPTPCSFPTPPCLLPSVRKRGIIIRTLSVYIHLAKTTDDIMNEMVLHTHTSGGKKCIPFHSDCLPILLLLLFPSTFYCHWHQLFHLISESIELSIPQNLH